VPRRIVVFAVFLAACGPPSIESLCDDAAQNQCDVCYSCLVDGPTLCGLAANASSADCVTELSARCVDQAATLERPKTHLQDCLDSQDSLSCDGLVRAAAQDAPRTTNQCVYFL